MTFLLSMRRSIALGLQGLAVQQTPTQSDERIARVTSASVVKTMNLPRMLL